MKKKKNVTAEESVEEEVDLQKEEESKPDEEDSEVKQPRYMRDPGKPSQSR